MPAPAPRDHPAHTTPLSAAPLDEASDENAHIVGPASAGDRHFLQDYLSGVHAGDGARVIRPVLPGMTSAPVVFTRVAKTPLGRSVGASPGGDTLQVVEKLVEPWGGRLVDL